MYRSACYVYRGADKSLALPGRRQARKHVRDTRDFNNIETRAVIKFFFQGKAPKEIHAILTGTLDCFFSGRAKDFSAPPVYVGVYVKISKIVIFNAVNFALYKYTALVKNFLVKFTTVSEHFHIRTVHLYNTKVLFIQQMIH